MYKVYTLHRCFAIATGRGGFGKFIPLNSEQRVIFNLKKADEENAIRERNGERAMDESFKQEEDFLMREWVPLSSPVSKPPDDWDSEILLAKTV